jgi:hypothetical protein
MMNALLKEESTKLGDTIFSTQVVASDGLDAWLAGDKKNRALRLKLFP